MVIAQKNIEDFLGHSPANEKVKVSSTAWFNKSQHVVNEVSTLWCLATLTSVYRKS